MTDAQIDAVLAMADGVRRHFNARPYNARYKEAYQLLDLLRTLALEVRRLRDRLSTVERDLDKALATGFAACLECERLRALLTSRDIPS